MSVSSSGPVPWRRGKGPPACRPKAELRWAPRRLFRYFIVSSFIKYSSKHFKSTRLSLKLQISQNEEAEPVERMDTSPDAAVQPSVKIERLESSPARQKSPSYLNQQIRTNMSVVSNCVVSSPTKMIRSPGVGPSTGVSTLCDSGSSMSQASANSLNPQCNVTFAMSKKRLKISDSSERVTASDEVLGIRKRILEHKLARLKSIRERYRID